MMRRGTRVKVTSGVSAGQRGTVVEPLADNRFLVYLDEESERYVFKRSELEVHVEPPSVRIMDHAELLELAASLGVRPDWHEPDESGVTVEIRGKEFDNAGFWDDDHRGNGSAGKDHEELHVAILKDGDQVATVNLATLFAFATGYRG